MCDSDAISTAAAGEGRVPLRGAASWLRRPRRELPGPVAPQCEFRRVGDTLSEPSLYCEQHVRVMRPFTKVVLGTAVVATFCVVGLAVLHDLDLDDDEEKELELDFEFEDVEPSKSCCSDKANAGAVSTTVAPVVLPSESDDSGGSDGHLELDDKDVAWTMDLTDDDLADDFGHSQPMDVSDVNDATAQLDVEMMPLRGSLQQFMMLNATFQHPPATSVAEFSVPEACELPSIPEDMEVATGMPAPLTPREQSNQQVEHQILDAFEKLTNSFTDPAAMQQLECLAKSDSFMPAAVNSACDNSPHVLEGELVQLDYDMETDSTAPEATTSDAMRPFVDKDLMWMSYHHLPNNNADVTYNVPRCDSEEIYV